MSVPLWGWVAVVGVILVMLAVDLAAHRNAHVVSVREAAAWSAVWVTLGVAFGAVVWWLFGSEYASQYFAGYVIEKTLAVDNVFVFAIIFSYFAVPREHQHRVLFYGVLGALVFRGVFIAAGSALIASAAWVLYVFGAFLVLTGWRMARTRHEHPDPSRSRTVRLFQRLVPTTSDYHGAKFFVRENGRRLATPLLTVLVLIEVSDIIFAVDSIPAIFAVTQEPFLVFTSNAFAILGLRALYFLLADLVDRFVHLKLGLAIVLVWVGVKMLLADVWHVPTVVSLAVVIAIITISIVASLRATRPHPTPAPHEGAVGGVRGRSAAPITAEYAGDPSPRDIYPGAAGPRATSPRDHAPQEPADDLDVRRPPVDPVVVDRVATSPRPSTSTTSGGQS